MKHQWTFVRPFFLSRSTRTTYVSPALFSSFWFRQFRVLFLIATTTNKIRIVVFPQTVPFFFLSAFHRSVTAIVIANKRCVWSENSTPRNEIWPQEIDFNNSITTNNNGSTWQNCWRDNPAKWVIDNDSLPCLVSDMVNRKKRARIVARAQLRYKITFDVGFIIVVCRILKNFTFVSSWIFICVRVCVCMSIFALF